MSRGVVRRGALLYVFATLGFFAVTTPVGAHVPGRGVGAPPFALGFVAVVALTVTLGVLGGAVVVRWRATDGGRTSRRLLPALLVVLGCWAAVTAVQRSRGLATVLVVVGAVATWALRNRVLGGHHGCDQVALGVVVLHRFVEGAFLATLYAVDAALGVGAALVLAAHTAAETGIVTGLWSTGRGAWGVVVVVQGAFVVGAFGGGFLTGVLTPAASVTVLALLGGTLIATGLATASRHRHVTPPPA